MVDGLLMLTENLRAEDTVSIVTYAGHSGITLQPTRGNQKASIQAALRSLHAGVPPQEQMALELRIPSRNNVSNGAQ